MTQPFFSSSLSRTNEAKTASKQQHGGLVSLPRPVAEEICKSLYLKCEFFWQKTSVSLFGHTSHSIGWEKSDFNLILKNIKALAKMFGSMQPLVFYLLVNI